MTLLHFVSKALNVTDRGRPRCEQKSRGNTVGGPCPPLLCHASCRDQEPERSNHTDLFIQHGRKYKHSRPYGRRRGRSGHHPQVRFSVSTMSSQLIDVTCLPVAFGRVRLALSVNVGASDVAGLHALNVPKQTAVFSTCQTPSSVTLRGS